MANRFQGITVEIGGDTTKLQTALKSVNSEIKNTQSQLRDVEKLLKIDPGNTELLSQKQKLLSQAVQETKEKLDTLKTAAEQSNQALEDGTITREQYDALQRRLLKRNIRLNEWKHRQANLQQHCGKYHRQVKKFRRRVLILNLLERKCQLYLPGLLQQEQQAQAWLWNLKMLWQR